MTQSAVLLGLPPAERAGSGAHVIVDTARRAEDAGFAGIVVSDHVVMGRHTDRYPWGPFPGQSDAPWIEPLITLAFVAAATTTLRLCTGVLIAPLRPAALLAKTAATLDVMSAGRLELGVGTGWQREEFEASGVDFEARGQALTDTIGACRALWAGGPASFTSATVSFSDIWCEPRSARPGGPPVLFSGTLTPRNIRRVADLGDGWIPIMGEPLEGVAIGVETLRKELAAVGRDPATLQVRAPLPLVKGDDGRPDLQRTLAASSEVLATGATSLVLPFGAFVRDEQVIPEWFQRAARALSAAD